VIGKNQAKGNERRDKKNEDPEIWKRWGDRGVKEKNGQSTKRVPEKRGGRRTELKRRTSRAMGGDAPEKGVCQVCKSGKKTERQRKEKTKLGHNGSNAV